MRSYRAGVQSVYVSLRWISSLQRQPLTGKGMKSGGCIRKTSSGETPMLKMVSSLNLCLQNERSP